MTTEPTPADVAAANGVCRPHSKGCRFQEHTYVGPTTTVGCTCGRDAEVQAVAEMLAERDKKARRDAAREMRERAALACDAVGVVTGNGHAIRALPLDPPDGGEGDE